MGAAFSYRNHIDDDATALSAGDGALALPVTNLKMQRLLKPWRSGVSITTWFGADFGSAQPVDVVGVFAALGPADTIRIRLSAVALGNSELLDTGALACGNVPGYDQYLYLCGDTINARYMKVDIAAASLAGQGYFDVGRAWAGALWSPVINYGPTPAFAMKDTSTIARTPRSGAVFVDKGALYRTASLTFDWLTEAEKAVGEDMDVFVGTSDQVLLIPDLGGDLAREPILGKQTALNPFTQPTTAIPPRYSRQYAIEQDL